MSLVERAKFAYDDEEKDALDAASYALMQALEIDYSDMRSVLANAKIVRAEPPSYYVAWIEVQIEGMEFHVNLNGPAWVEYRSQKDHGNHRKIQSLKDLHIALLRDGEE
jgi:hypothetical protein